MIVGYTSGVFDLLHEGHINYLTICKQQCDFLFVGIDCDELVRYNKGQDRPFESEYIRYNKIFNTNLVDIVFLKNKSTIDLLSAIQPSICFIPDNKDITKERKKFHIRKNIHLSIIPYTQGISTSVVAKGLNLI